MRDTCLDRVRGDSKPWDMVVIGGGATGLGSALDAAARGYRTLLLEARDFAQGTSSRSTKLIHGGVRYLERGEFRLVGQALHERGRLLRNAPHLVRPLPLFLPARGLLERAKYRFGLGVYDLLAGRLGLGRSRSVDVAEALRLLPTLRVDGLSGGVVYRDAQFDDARLAIALLRTFLDRGGTALNAAPVLSLIVEDGRVRGVRFRDDETGQEHEARALVVVNGAGVWADEVRRMASPGTPDALALSRGSHVVLDRAFLPGETALLVPKTEDGRVLFAIPWEGKTLVGTTDTPAPGVSVEPRPDEDEIAYLLEYAGRYLTKAPGLADIRSRFAGLRPLVKGARGGPTAALSRDHHVEVSATGLVAVLGGKWTTYRRMAADAVDRAAAVGGLARRPCPTADLPLHGAATVDPADEYAVYGSDAPALRTMAAERPELAEKIHPDLSYRKAEVIWAARFELARTVEDVLARRTRALFLDARAAAEAAPAVASLLAGELGRPEGWADRQVVAFRELAGMYGADGPA